MFKYVKEGVTSKCGGVGSRSLESVRGEAGEAESTISSYDTIF